ncbi:MAG: hypothetical protein EPN97_02225 [Alphaproteobacteria bacterium]|nr:MAG: hypothetical protein EPN97_02225 [Alphaproteobacteria bacterium]
MSDEPNPDFRKMTIADLREGISELNKIIKKLKEFQKTQSKRLWVSWGAGTAATAAISVIFPPAALLVAATSTMLTIEPAAGAAMSNNFLAKAEELRHKFKTVYRARPGRAFHDVAARREKEKTRRKAGRKFKFPGFGR